jgi:SAM-dependent methyltransferase
MKQQKRHEERAVDAGLEVRYAAETQDLAYRTGAYDFAESLDLAPRMAILAGYLRHLGCRRVLDVGCGTAGLLDFLPQETAYVGVDISPTVIEAARARHAARPEAQFHVATFREWDCPVQGFDALVWAGIGRTWTRTGKKGNFADWLDILDRAEPWLAKDAAVILEMVSPHWPSMEPLIAGRYRPLAGCDLDCLVDDHRAVRSVRVFRRKAD